MAGYEPPSFSLGLDLGLDSEPQNVPEEPPTRVPSPDPVPHGSGNGDEDCGPEVVDEDYVPDDDLWKDFCPMKGAGIPTPALDEVCGEYFQSLKAKNVTKKMKSNVCMSNNMGGQGNTISSQNDEARGSDEPLPPAHRYFFHEDPRIQKLVRSRLGGLAHFSPLGVTDKKGNQQPNSSVIDYMRQFSHEEASKQQATQKIKKSSARGRNKSRKSNAEEVLHASGSWVDPKSNASTPKDAGKRRVQANGQSAGHWYTGPDGRKVYVTGGGQELTGRSAYRQYRKVLVSNSRGMINKRNGGSFGGTVQHRKNGKDIFGEYETKDHMKRKASEIEKSNVLRTCSIDILFKLVITSY